MTKEQLERWRSLGFPFDEFYNQIAIDTPKKTLIINHITTTQDKENYYFKFKITASGLKKGEGQIVVKEINRVFPDTILNSTTKTITITPNGESSYTAVLSKKIIENLDPKLEYDGFEFKGFFSCDGISAETNQFKIDNAKKEEKNIEEKKKECLCKKTALSPDDLKYIVTQLRKLDTRPISINPLDAKGNRTYKDKDGNIISSTPTGKEPKESVGRNVIIVNKSVFEDFDDEDKQIKERLFYLDSDGLNVRESEANYIEFAKQINNTFKKFEINTCLRRIHFFAQSYVETQKLTTTYETNPSSSVSGGDYYRGRGLKQLTHDYNYLRYYDFRNKTNFFKTYMDQRNSMSESVVKFNERTKNEHISKENMKKVDDFVKLVSTELFYACDAAGWYWSLNKINDYADKDDIKTVSALVNNPSAKDIKSTSSIKDYDKRKKYYDLMKIIFDYENCK